MATWDGSGIVVSKQPISLIPFQLAWVCAEALPAVAIALLLLVLFHAAWRQRLRTQTSRYWILTSVLALMIPTILISTGRHCLLPDGAFVDESGLRIVRQIHSPGRFSEITDADEMRLLVKQQSTILVDARFPGDFARGHIPGSVNIPVYAKKNDRQQVLSSLRPTDQIVVYCQSSRCAFSDRVADSLIADGFTTVSVFRPGWISWRENQQ
jgi:rhodanese-related sulfurtransferase